MFYKLEIKDQKVYINGDLINEPYVEHKDKVMKNLPGRDNFGPIIIPEDCYFMMGDNRDNSADSRFFGFVGRKLIVGRATMVVISREGSFLHPRWSRFFKDLS